MQRKGRPSSDNVQLPTIQRPVIKKPDAASRMDSSGHWPVHTNKGRCRLCVEGASRLTDTLSIQINEILPFKVFKTIYFD